MSPFDALRRSRGAAPERTRRASGRGQLAFGVVIAAVAVLALLAVYVVAEAEQAAHDRAEGRLAAQAAAQLAKTGQGAEASLLGVRGLFQASQEVTTGEFDRYAAEIVQSPGVSSIGYLEWVRDSERAAWERRVGREIVVVAPDGTPVTAPRRPRYLVLRHYLSREPPPRLLAIDVFAELRRRAAIEGARRNGDAQASAPVVLARGRPGTVLFLPVGGQPGSSSSAASQAAFVNAVFRSDLLVEQIVSGLPDGVRVSVVDGGATFATVGGGVSDPAAAASRTVEFAGREWQLLIEDPERPFPWATLGVGLSGLTVAAALIALLLGVRRRERLVEAEVAARMRERDDATAIAREREVRFAALGAHVPGGVLLTDAEGRCEYVNDRWAELAGISPGEALGEGWFEAVHPDDRVQVGEEWARAVRSQTEFELDYRLLAPDGTVRWVLGRATPFMDPASGEVSGFLGFVFDLTERLEAADALRESEERYRSVVEAAIDAIVVVDGDGRITSANDALVRIFGWPVHAVLDQPITMLVPDWTTDPTEGGHLVPGEAVETEGVRRDGSTFPLRIALESLALVGTTAQTAILQDLTDLKVAEALVADERDRLTAVIAAMQDGLVLLSPDGVGLVCNPRLCQILGVAEDDVIGSATPLRAATPEGRLRLRSLAAHAAAGVPGEVDAEFERPDGALISAIVSAAPIVDAAGEVVAVVETLKDATERKRLEEARDEFISVMSHELRTPLTSVHASLSMLEELAEDEQHEDAERRLLAIAQNNSERLMSLINDVLDLRRLSSGKEGLRYGTHRVAEMAHAAADPMAPLASQRGVAIRTDELPDDLELDCDRDKLVQVLTNYLSNAVKFSPPGGTVAVHAERVGSEVRISVADEGQGVRAEDRKRIFERFEMGDASDARRVGGTGLGLAISRSIADAHGGRVWVEPADGGGSCFVLAVPRHRPDRGEPAGAGPSLDYFSR